MISIFLFLCAASTLAQAQEKHTLSGYIRDGEGEALIGATIFAEETERGTISNAYGFYSLTLPAGTYRVLYSYLGYTTVTDTIDLQESISHNIVLSPSTIDLQAVEMRSGQRNRHIEGLGTGRIELQNAVIGKIPHLLGEADLFKTLQLLPGIQSSGEGTSGFVVRGGNTDQNLILLDEAIVYNPFHLMGFFSVFNRDALQNITVYKGDIPAQYGGRLSSLVDVRMKDGSLRKRIISGGIGTVSSHLNIELPLIKERSSLMLAARRSYADLFLPLSNDPDIKNNRLYFYDINAKLNFSLNQSNRLYYSFYKGRDAFLLSKLVLVSWGNLTQTLRWNHLFSDRLFSNLNLVYNAYDYDLGKNADLTGITWESGLNDLSLKYDFTLFAGNGQTIRFGAGSILHHFDPGAVSGTTDRSLYNSVQLPRSNALESSIYYSHQIETPGRFGFEIGIRYSHFAAMGKTTVYGFDEFYQPTDTSEYGPGEVYQTYGGFEPRLGIRYSLNSFSSLKASYSRTRQYLHLASNTGADTPLDVWLPSGKHIRPQTADQFSIGYFRNVYVPALEISVEAYMKQMHQQIDFRDHARIFLNPLLEAEFRVGEGWSYGLEFLVRKSEGRLTGWIGYTLSRSMKKIGEVNQGKAYPSDFDRLHDLSVVLSYDISTRSGFGLNWVYYSGLPVTFPSGKFEYWNSFVPVYTERNARRMPDYHRLDLSYTLKSKPNPNRSFQGEWVFSVYNAYYRKNAWMIYFTSSEDNPSTTEARKLYMFPIIPSVSYHFRF